MKKFLVTLVAVAALLIPSLALKADHDRIISPEQLPAAAKAFVQQHFPQLTISFAKKDYDNMKTKYEVTLSDGTEIDFSSKGEWDKVDRHYNAVPDAIVPAAIKSYVQANFPNTPIVKIDIERHGSDIELANDLELKFDKGGRLMYIDD